MSFRGGQQPQRGGRGGNPEEEVMQTMMIKLTMSINKQCFNECVTNFGTDTLSQSESSCIRSCATRQSGAFVAMNDLTTQITAKQGGAGGMF